MPVALTSAGATSATTLVDTPWYYHNLEWFKNLKWKPHSLIAHSLTGLAPKSLWLPAHHLASEMTQWNLSQNLVSQVCTWVNELLRKVTQPHIGAYHKVKASSIPLLGPRVLSLALCQISQWSSTLSLFSISPAHFLCLHLEQTTSIPSRYLPWAP